jgi:acyl transferase domain-containing protein
LVRRLCTSVTNSADTVKEEIAKPEEHSRINEAALSQPATTALQIAFVILLEKYNIRPARVCGHSSGEIAAAFAAGYVDFHSCLAIAYYRGVAATELASIDSFCSDGAMMAVGAEVSVLRPLLNSLTSGVANIACYNSPRSLTVSGDAAAISELKQHLDKLGVFNRLLRVRTAYHSDHMGLVVDRYLENLGKFITPITTSERKCTFHSSVTTSVEQPAIVASPTRCDVYLRLLIPRICHQ